jgi:thioredoxin 1
MATIDITERSFDETITDHSIVFVDFWAGWCGPCRAFAPTFTAASAQYPEIVFAKVDTEAEQNLAAAAGIRSIPTLMAFRDKILVFSQPGALNASSLDEVIVAVQNLDMTAVRASISAQQTSA